MGQQSSRPGGLVQNVKQGTLTETKLRFLLDNGFTINETDLRGRTALVRAVIRGDDAVTMMLLRYNADPRLLDQEGRTLLHHALLSNRTSLLERILNDPIAAPLTRPLMFHSPKNLGTVFALAAHRGKVPTLWFLSFLRVLQQYPRAYGEELVLRLEGFIDEVYSSAVIVADNKHATKPIKFARGGLKATVYRVTRGWEGPPPNNQPAASGVPAAEGFRNSNPPSPAVSRNSSGRRASVPVYGAGAGAGSAPPPAPSAGKRGSVGGGGGIVSSSNQALAAGASYGLGSGYAQLDASSSSLAPSGAVGSYVFTAPSRHSFGDMPGDPAWVIPPVVTVPMPGASSYPTPTRSGPRPGTVQLQNRRVSLAADGKGLYLHPQEGGLFSGPALRAEFLPFGRDTRFGELQDDKVLQVIIDHYTEVRIPITEPSGQALTAAANGIKAVAATVLPFYEGRCRHDAYIARNCRAFVPVCDRRRAVARALSGLADAREEVALHAAAEQAAAARADYAAALEAKRLRLLAEERIATGMTGKSARGGAPPVLSGGAPTVDQDATRTKLVNTAIQQGVEAQEFILAQLASVRARLATYEQEEAAASRKTEWERAQSAHRARLRFAFAAEVLRECADDVEAALEYFMRDDSPPSMPGSAGAGAGGEFEPAVLAAVAAGDGPLRAYDEAEEEEEEPQQQQQQQQQAPVVVTEPPLTDDAPVTAHFSSPLPAHVHSASLATPARGHARSASSSRAYQLLPPATASFEGSLTQAPPVAAAAPAPAAERFVASASPSPRSATRAPLANRPVPPIPVATGSKVNAPPSYDDVLAHGPAPAYAFGHSQHSLSNSLSPAPSPTPASTRTVGGSARSLGAPLAAFPPPSYAHGPQQQAQHHQQQLQGQGQPTPSASPSLVAPSLSYTVSGSGHTANINSSSPYHQVRPPRQPPPIVLSPAASGTAAAAATGPAASAGKGSSELAGGVGASGSLFVAGAPQHQHVHPQGPGQELDFDLDEDEEEEGVPRKAPAAAADIPVVGEEEDGFGVIIGQGPAPVEDETHIANGLPAPASAASTTVGTDSAQNPPLSSALSVPAGAASLAPAPAVGEEEEDEDQLVAALAAAPVASASAPEKKTASTSNSGSKRVVIMS